MEHSEKKLYIFKVNKPLNPNGLAISVSVRKSYGFEDFKPVDWNNVPSDAIS
jgi:hypothetical protein